MCTQREFSAWEQVSGKSQRWQNKQVCEASITGPPSMESTEIVAASA